MAITFTNWFTWAGKAWFAGNTANTAHLTTIPDEIEDFAQVIPAAQSAEIKAATAGVPGTIAFVESQAVSINNAVIRGPLTNLLNQMIYDDNPQVSRDIQSSLEELIRQMEAGSQSVDASNVGATAAYGGSNVGSGALVLSTKRPDGRAAEYIYAESIELECQESGVDGTFSVKGEGSIDLLHPRWPQGSGINQTISASDATTDNLIPSGDFETTDDNEADLPAEWIAQTATLGTTVNVTPVEVQTIVVSGTPTSGYYVVSFTDKNSKVQTTKPLVYSADSSALQTALRELVGLELITIVESGTGPNYTHTITMTGVPNPGQFTSVESTDSGSFAHATTAAGSANVVRGARSLNITGNGSEVTKLLVPLSLDAKTHYAIHALMKTDGSVAAGQMKFSLLDAIGGSVINDDEAVANTLTIDVTALTSSFTSQSAAFITPTNIPDIVYLLVEVSTAITATENVWIDELSLKVMDTYYLNGVVGALFTGVTPWVADDTITVTATNNRAGAIGEWMNRTFDLRNRGLLIPSHAGGSETQDDALIA
jgi:hypothetical protein